LLDMLRLKSREEAAVELVKDTATRDACMLGALTQDELPHCTTDRGPRAC